MINNHLRTILMLLVMQVTSLNGVTLETVVNIATRLTRYITNQKWITFYTNLSVKQKKISVFFLLYVLYICVPYYVNHILQLSNYVSPLMLLNNYDIICSRDIYIIYFSTWTKLLTWVVVMNNYFSFVMHRFIFRTQTLVCSQNSMFFILQSCFVQPTLFLLLFSKSDFL